jgi:hypothetical protein
MPVTCENGLGLRGDPASVPRRPESSVDRGPRVVLRIGPEVGVRVERLGGAGVPQTGLDGLDARTLGDEQRGVVVPQRVEADALRDAGTLDGGSPDACREARAVDRRSTIVGEDQGKVVGRRYFARCAASSSITTSGSGTVR